MFKAVNIITVGVTEIVAAVPGKRIRVLGFTLASTGIVGVAWQSDTDYISGVMGMVAGSSIVVPNSLDGQFETAIGEALNLILDADAVRVGGHLLYRLVP